MDGLWVKNKMEEKDNKKESLYLKLMPYIEKYGILLLLVLMILVMHILQPDVFLSWRNVTNVFKQISWQSMLALGVFMVIVTAGIDLSVGSIMMLSLMILAIVAKAGAPWFIVVIMDEPTAALAIKEVGKVLDLINSLKKTGVGVIVISHRMDDIFSVCDRVMALFQGTNFAESELSNTSRDEVIGWIMGKK